MRTIDTHRRDAWLRHPVGARLLKEEKRRLGRVLEDLFGYFLVQAGGWGRHAALAESSRILHRFVIDSAPEGADLVADAGDLPLAADTVDVMVLPHTLEFASNPHQVLREAHRVLVAEGRLVILGFNPWSAWGLWRPFLKHRGVPWSGRFITERRLRDWLALLGFEVDEVQRCAYSLPLGLGDLNAWLDETGGKGWPLPAGAYLMVARKRVLPLTMIRPRWATTEPGAMTGAATLRREAA